MITLNNPPGPAAVTAAKASILPTTSLLGVAGKMIPADVQFAITSSGSYIRNCLGSIHGDIGGGLTVDSVTYPSRLGSLSITLVGAAPQTVSITGDCTGGVVDAPTDPWILSVSGVGVGGSTTITAADTGLGSLEISAADVPSGTLVIDISSNPLTIEGLEALATSIQEAGLTTELDITGIEVSLTSAFWQYILIHTAAHALSVITTDAHTITVRGTDAVAAGVDGDYVWSPATGKFVNSEDADLTIYRASSKYEIFDEAVLKYKSSTLVSETWQTPANGSTNIVTVLVGPL